jgi:hypothetical protein
MHRDANAKQPRDRRLLLKARGEEEKGRKGRKKAGGTFINTLIARVAQCVARFPAVIKA